MRNRLTFMLALLLGSGLVFAQQKQPLNVCMISGSAEYRSKESLTELKTHLERDYNAVCTLLPGEDKGADLPGIEAIEKCDVMLLFARRLTLPDKELAVVKKYFADGKPVVGVRTASHAFQNWLEFDGLVLGAKYRGHAANKAASVDVAEKAKDHPVLAGFKPFKSHVKLYKNEEFGKDVQVLLSVSVGDRPEPAAWTNIHNGGRVFYTSLGQPEHFKEAGFRRMLVNALFWAAKRDVEPNPNPPEKPDPLLAITKYEFGQDRKALCEVEDMVREVQDDPDRRAEMSRRLCKLLRSDVTADCKKFVCRQLRHIGSDESVSTLADLLTDKDLSHMARYALESIRTPRAGAALVAALKRLDGELLVGVINSLGVRREDRAVGDLSRLLHHDNDGIACAAASALGRIGGAEAAKALMDDKLKGAAQARPALLAALLPARLDCADRLLEQGHKSECVAVCRAIFNSDAPWLYRMAALRVLASALGADAVPQLVDLMKGDDAQTRKAAADIATSIPGRQVTEVLAARLPELPPAGQVALIDALSVRGDAAALQSVAEATKHESQEVRLSALKALASLGNVASVPVLVKGMTTGSSAERGVALWVIDRLRGEGVDEEMLKLAQQPTCKARVELIHSLANRAATGTVPGLLELARDENKAVRMEALKALGVLIKEKDIESLLGLVTKATSEEERKAAAKAFVTATRSFEDREKCARPVIAALEGADMTLRCALLRILGQIGGKEALEAVRAALKEKDEQLHDTVVRTLCEWPDASPIEDILRITKTTQNQTHKILALRGYIRMVDRVKGKSVDQKLDMYQTAMDIAERAEEKKQVLAGIGALKDPKALKVLVGCLDNAELKKDAAGCVIGMAGDKNFRKKHRDALKEALNKVLAATDDKMLTNRAKEYLGKLGK